MPPLPNFPLLGEWTRGQVRLTRVKSTRQHIARVEAAVDAAWTAAASRPGIHLFNGPMCRLESSHVSPAGTLELAVSETDYKSFLGTNLSHPEFSQRYPNAMANPIGLSALLQTADDYLVLGHRNASVAYYPNHIHPFAGALEPTDPDPFTAIDRELSEELHFTAADVYGEVCTGIASDLTLQQPELMFLMRTPRRLSDLTAALDTTEHRAVWSVPATSTAVISALHADEPRTPIGTAALLLWGRQRWGERWFAQTLAMAKVR